MLFIYKRELSIKQLRIAFLPNNILFTWNPEKDFIRNNYTWIRIITKATFILVNPLKNRFLNFHELKFGLFFVWGKREVYWTTIHSRLRRNKGQWDISRVETDRFVTHILYNSNSKHLICWRIYNCLFIHVKLSLLSFLCSRKGREILI